MYNWTWVHVHILAHAIIFTYMYTYTEQLARAVYCTVYNSGIAAAVESMKPECPL